MGLFESHRSYLGVDIGSSGIKLVELGDDKGRPRLVTYGYTERSADIVRVDSKENKELVIELLKLLLKKTQASSKKVIGALPSYAVFSSIIDLPAMPRKELAEAVQWEAKKFVPMPIEEMILDWRELEPEVARRLEGYSFRSGGTLPRSRNGGKAESMTGSTVPGALQGTSKTSPSLPQGKGSGTKILITAAPKALVQRTIEIFKAVGLELSILETETFALLRSVVGNDQSPVMLVDFSARVTDLSIVVAGTPLITRSMDIGGELITKTIAQTLNIDIDRAEQFKQDIGVMASARDGSQIHKTIEFAVTSLINEIRHMLNVYQSQQGQPIEKIVLAGGSAFLPHLPEYMSQQLSLKVVIGDPWSRVMYPVELKPVLEELGPRFAIATGLAMREII
jgi:type IV pilus assembly protein PilM